MLDNNNKKLVLNFFLSVQMLMESVTEPDLIQRTDFMIRYLPTWLGNCNKTKQTTWKEAEKRKLYGLYTKTP